MISKPAHSTNIVTQHSNFVSVPNLLFSKLILEVREEPDDERSYFSRSGRMGHTSL